MAASIKTQFGHIRIADEVIARVAGLAAMECYGVVGMAANNTAGGFVQLLMGDNLTKGIKVSTEEEKVNIEIHIIVEYGTNISVIADNLIDTVSYKVTDMLGLSVGDIQVFVEGIRTDRGDEE